MQFSDPKSKILENLEPRLWENLIKFSNFFFLKINFIPLCVIYDIREKSTLRKIFFFLFAKKQIRFD